ncbi:MAG: hypothetical protein Q8K93_19935 [Reyranella sp.]|nr:hypothetical protein [Reyranella sp.]MDP2374249.1 hypothetical protein [Reyranella sp.]
MNRAMNGSPMPIYRNGRQVGSVQQFDNRLLQFLLKAHRPDIHGERKQSTLPPLPFDLAKRLAAAAIRADAHDARRAEEKRRAERDKRGD